MTMKVKSFYSSGEVCGQIFEVPSATQPNLAMSLEQLVAEYSVGNLPNLSVLQDYFDAELPEDNPNADLSEMELHSENDPKFADKADMLERFLESSNIRKAVFNKLKQQHEFKKQKEAKLLEAYRTKFGELDSK